MLARRGGVYLAVVGTVAAVTVLSLTGVALRKSFNDRARLGAHTADAHRLARSAGELVIHQAVTDEDSFRKSAAAGVVFDGAELGQGSISATIRDADTDSTPTASTGRFAVVADATVGSARSRLGFTISEEEPPLTTMMRDLGAVAYWPMDEATGATVVSDPIGGHHGTYSDPDEAGFIDHPNGGEVPYYDWISDGATVPHHDDFLLAEGTLVFWVYVMQMPAATTTLGLVNKEENAWDDSPHLSVFVNDDAELVACLADKSRAGWQCEERNGITPQTWHHVAVSWGDALRLYIDGALVSTANAVKVGLASTGTTDPNTSDWHFGVRNKMRLLDQPSQPMNGSVCRVGLFDRAFSEKEIQELMGATGSKGPMAIEPGSFTRVTD